jgi:hypothetical protein
LSKTSATISALPIHKNLLQDPIGSLPEPRLAELNIRLALALGLVAG